LKAVIFPDITFVLKLKFVCCCCGIFGKLLTVFTPVTFIFQVLHDFVFSKQTKKKACARAQMTGQLRNNQLISVQNIFFSRARSNWQGESAK
jgi:hypothetical protein